MKKGMISVGYDYSSGLHVTLYMKSKRNRHTMTPYPSPVRLVWTYTALRAMKGTKIVIMPMNDIIHRFLRPVRSTMVAPRIEERKFTMLRPPLIPVLGEKCQFRIWILERGARRGMTHCSVVVVMPTLVRMLEK